MLHQWSCPRRRRRCRLTQERGRLAGQRVARGQTDQASHDGRGATFFFHFTSSQRNLRLHRKVGLGTSYLVVRRWRSCMALVITGRKTTADTITGHSLPWWAIPFLHVHRRDRLEVALCRFLRVVVAENHNHSFFVNAASKMNRLVMRCAEESGVNQPMPQQLPLGPTAPDVPVRGTRWSAWSRGTD